MIWRRRMVVVQLLAALLVLGSMPARAMSFSLVPVGANAQAIKAEGEIEVDSAEKLVAFIERHIGSGRLHSVIFIHSPGGAVGGAMKLGVVLRKMQAAVVVARPVAVDGARGAGAVRVLPGRCMSACVYAMMGGIRRVVPPDSRLVLHRMYRMEYGPDPAEPDSTRRRIFAAPSLVETLSDYTASMGVSRDLVTAAEGLKGESVRVLTAREIARWKVGVPKL